MFDGDYVKVCAIGERVGVVEVWVLGGVPDRFDEVMVARVGGRGCGVGLYWSGL